MTEQELNYDADVQILKGKIKVVLKELPAYDVFKSFVVNTFDDQSFKIQLSGLTRQRIKIRRALSEISSIYEDFKSTYDDIIAEYRTAAVDSFLKTSLDKLEVNDDITGKINTMKRVKRNLSSILIDIDDNIELIKDLEGSSSSMTQAQDTTENFKSGIKLSSVDIPEFDGNPEDFLEFIASFDELVHTNPELSEIEKGIRLKHCLKGRAAMCIKGIPITRENYSIMYAKLLRKFEMASVNKHAIVEKLESLPEAGKSADECMDKLSEIEVILNQLECAKMGITDSTNLLFHRLILSKFPNYIVERVVEKTKNDDFTVNDLVQALENTIFTKSFGEKAMIKQRVHTLHEQTQYSRYRNSTQVPATFHNIRTSYIPSNSDANSIASSCAFCPSQNHDTNGCGIPVQAKLTILNENKACWKCFQTNHDSFHCDLPNCVCGRAHHASLCRQRDNRPGNNNVSRHQMNTQPTNIVQQEFQRRPYIGNNINVPNLQTNPMIIDEIDGIPVDKGANNLQCNLATISSNKYVPPIAILMTCSAQVLTPDIDRHVEASIFFDTGSQRTIVSEKFAKSMQLKIIANEQYVFSGINGDSKVIDGKVVEINIKDVEGNVVTMHALTKQSICFGFKAAKLDPNDLDFVSSKNINVSHSHISGEHVCPDILIGVDYYCKMVKNKPTTDLPSGLRMIDTICGITILGVPNRIMENKKDVTTYLSNNCTVKVMPSKVSKVRGTIGSYEQVGKNKTVAATRDAALHKDQQKNNLKNHKVKQVILPASIISLLKRRVLQLKKSRRTATLLKLKRVPMMKNNCNEPAEQTLSTKLPIIFVDYKMMFLKKNEIISEDKRTSNKTVELIHHESNQLKNTEVCKAFEDSNESLGGKLIH